MVWPCSRSSGLARTILQGTVKGKRKRGRQKKRWEGNIKEWTGMDFASSTRAAENRTGWKGIVGESSVVPRQPSKVMGLNRIEEHLRIILKTPPYLEFWPQGYKTFFMLNSSMKFFLLINVKMPTIVSILTFTDGKNSLLGLSEPKN